MTASSEPHPTWAQFGAVYDRLDRIEAEYVRQGRLIGRLRRERDEARRLLRQLTDEPRGSAEPEVSYATVRCGICGECIGCECGSRAPRSGEQG